MDKILYITKTFSHKSPGRTAKYEKFFGFLLSRGVRLHLLTSMEPGIADYSSWESRGLHIRFVRYPLYFFKKLLFRRTATSPQGPDIRKTGRGGLLKRMIDPFKKKTFLIPDHYLDWMLCALPVAFRIVKKEKIKLVITACFPFSSHLIGLLLKKFSDVYWIAEFRDPWASNPLWERTGLVQAASSALERLTVKYADRIVLYKGWFPGGVQYFVDKYRTDPGKVIELPYVGYDPDDFAVEAERHDRFSIIYIGRFYGGDYSPDNFFIALKKCIEEGLIPKDRIQALFYGPIDERHPELVSKLGLSGIVSFRGSLPHCELVPALKSGHVGLWIMGSEKSYDTNIPSKIFDYAGAGIPVMALVPDGSEAASFIRETGIGQVADTSSPDRIKLVIRDMYLLHSEGKLALKGPLTGLFSTERTHEEYWKLIEGIKKEQPGTIIYLYSNQPAVKFEGRFYSQMRNFIDFLSELSCRDDSYKLVVPCKRVSSPPEGYFPIDMPKEVVELSHYVDHFGALVFSFINAIRFYATIAAKSKCNEIVVAGPGPNSFLFFMSFLMPASTRFAFFIRGDTLKTIQNIYRNRFPLNIISASFVRLFRHRINNLLIRQRAQAFLFGDKLREQYPSPESSVHVIYPLIDVKMIRKDARTDIPEQSPLKVLFVGRLSQEKNVFSLIEACEKDLDGARFSLSIVGFGQLEKAIREYISRSPMCGRINFIGNVSDMDRLVSIYDDHDLLCLPSKTEGVPRVVIEAFSRGMPVLSTPVGSLPVLFPREIFFLRGFGTSEILEGIKWCSSNRRKLSEMGRAAMGSVQKFTIGENATVVDSILRASAGIGI